MQESDRRLCCVKGLMERLVMEQAAVEGVEKQTRGQRNNPHWFDWRRNRITASVAHRIIHSRFVNGEGGDPPASYLAEITGNGGEGPGVERPEAMTWGIENEARAIDEYKLKTANQGRKVWVQECGFYIDPQNPWLGASPDGIVTERGRDQQLVLEVYCPFKHLDSTVADACRDDPDFCLEIQEGPGQPVYHLKRDHRYFTQVQVQMAVTGLLQADFVVFTPEETAIVQVDFDAEWWKETLPKLERFYRDAVLPYLQRMGQQARMQDP